MTAWTWHNNFSEVPRPDLSLVALQYPLNVAVVVKNRVTPNWNPSKWKHGPKPSVSWWLNFDPYPYPFNEGLPAECHTP